MAEEPQNPENQSRQEQSSSEVSNNLGKALNQQRELNQAGADFITVLKEIAAAQEAAAAAAAEANKNTKSANEYAHQQAASQRFIADRTKEITSLANKLSKFSREDFKSISKRNSFQATYNKAVDAQKSLIVKANELREDAKLVTGELKELELDKARALEAQVESTAELLEQAKKLKRSQSALANLQKPFEFIEKLISDIPVVRELFGELTKMSKKIAETYAETASIPTSLLSGVKQLGKGLLQLTLGAFITGLIRGFSKLSDSIAKVQTGLALSTEQASRLSGVLQGVKGTLFSLEEMEAAAIGFGAALGTSAIAAGETYERVALLSQRLGISAEQAAKIYSYGTDNINSFERQTNIIGGTNKKLNEQYHISIRLTDVLQDIAGASADTAVSLGKFPNGLAKAAYESRRLGLNLSEIKGVQEGLLDFTSSITAELNAEAILGKELNLDRARYYANQNDIVNLAKELYDISGGTLEFQKLGFIEQRAMAGIFKMSSEQFADMLVKREALQKIMKDEELAEFAKLSTQEQIAKLVEKYTGKDFNMSVDDARAKAIETLLTKEEAQGAKMFEQQKNALGAMSKLSKALEELGLKVAQLFTAMTGIDNPLDSLAKGVSKLVDRLDVVLLDFGVDFGYDKFKLTQEQYTKEKNRYTDEELSGYGYDKKAYASALKVASEEIGFTTSGERRSQILQAREGITELRKLLTKEGIVPTENEIEKRISASKKEAEIIAKNTSLINSAGYAAAGLYGAMGMAANRYVFQGAGVPYQNLSFTLGNMASNSVNKKLQESQEYQNLLTQEGNRVPEYVKPANEPADPNVPEANPNPNMPNKTFGPIVPEANPNPNMPNKTFGPNMPEANPNIPSGNTNIPVNDFTIKAHPKDTLVMAGGTKFGDETNQLLEKLIDTVNNSETNRLLQVLVDTVKQGGNVYLDRRKVGESLVLGYSSQ